jgi:hypothetical protein
MGRNTYSDLRMKLRNGEFSVYPSLLHSAKRNVSPLPSLAMGNQARGELPNFKRHFFLFAKKTFISKGAFYLFIYYFTFIDLFLIYYFDFTLLFPFKLFRFRLFISAFTISFSRVYFRA